MQHQLSVHISHMRAMSTIGTTLRCVRRITSRQLRRVPKLRRVIAVVCKVISAHLWSRLPRYTHGIGKDFSHTFASGLFLIIRSVVLCISCRAYLYIIFSHSLLLRRSCSRCCSTISGHPPIMISPAKQLSLTKFTPSLSASRACLLRGSSYSIAGYNSHSTQAHFKHLICIWE